MEVPLPATGEIKSALSAAESDTQLSEEQRSRLIDVYRRTLAFLDSVEETKQKQAVYTAARANAKSEAEAVKQQLDKEMTAAEGKQPSVPRGWKLEEVQQALQSDRTELATLEARLARLAKNIQSQDDGPARIRAALVEKTGLLEELKQVAAVAEAGSPLAQAQQWLQQAQTAALRAETVMLDQELQSLPMRLELMKAQRERAAFDLGLLREKIKLYDQYAVSLRQAEAQQVLSEVASEQAAVANAHPALQELAQANTLLTAEITARAEKLEQVKSRESELTEQALRYEQDLQNIQRKLELLGMSEALGRVLLEQQQRLPKPLQSRGDLAQRETLIADSSLRQLVYEDERGKLRRLTDYVAEKTAGLPESDAEKIRDGMTSFARTRRDLVERAIDIETTYLRELGDLDFAVRRLETATHDYREFISERLLWIRSSPPLTLQALAPISDDIASLLSPLPWRDVLLAVPAALVGSVFYPLLVALAGLLLFYRKRLRGLLDSTGENVGRVDIDRFDATLRGLMLTLGLALAWPLLTFTVGLALDNHGLESAQGKALAIALQRVSAYFLGLEILYYLLIPEGLARRHFNWSAANVKTVAYQFRKLEAVFLPSIFIAMVVNRSAPQEGQSMLAGLVMIPALMSLSRFFARVPSMMQGELNKLFAMRSARRRSLLGRLARNALVALPLLLMVSLLLGYVHTAIQFLALLVWTLGLFAVLLLLHELGVRGMRIMRLRLIERERLAALRAAQEAAASADNEEVVLEDRVQPDPEELGDQARYLLNAVLVVLALFGVWAVWSDVLPALGILDTIELWTTTEIIGGVETSSPVTPLDIIAVLLVAFVGLVLTRRLPALLELFLRQQMDLAAGTVYAGVTLVRYMLVAVFVVVVLGMLGANWGQIQWAVAALSVGIGFGLQEIVANFISGIILLFEQPIRVGDTVTVGETSGVVTRIRMRATTVRDWDGRELLVPNKEFITGRLLNWSLSDQQTRVIIEIGVAYGSDVPKAMKLALDAAHEHAEVLDEPAAFITFDAFGDNSLLLRLRAYLPSVDRRLTTASELRQAIDDKYREAGIVIAFPQRDVHLNTRGPLEVQLRGPEASAAS